MPLKSIVDIITGIFTLDFDRILGGFAIYFQAQVISSSLTVLTHLLIWQ